MIYIYRKKASESARDLAEALPINARKIGDLRKAHFGNGVRSGDVVVCWGEELAPIEGVKIINGSPIINKMVASMKLKSAGISTVEVAAQQPRPVPVVPPTYSLDQLRGFSSITKAKVQELIRSLQQFLSTPDPVVEQHEWLPRSFNHIGGHDLINRISTPDYWVKKEKLVEEYRIHIFNGKSIRAGVKVQREGVTSHPWVRSYDGGWMIKYDGFSSKKRMRELAAGAVKALGLEFGGVDLGIKENGDLMVLEVNRGPGLEGGTVTSYVNAISDWINGGA